MTQRYKYVLDKRGKYTTWIVSVAILLGGGALFAMTIGSFISALYISVVVAVVALCCLSIPRYIEINDNALNISCLLEIRQIRLDEIKSVREIGRFSFRKYVPFLANHGFFGYVGYYFDPSSWDIVKVYASDLSRLVEIEDIYEQRYLVSATDTTAFAADAIRAYTSFQEENNNC